jgi:hypothetical protein
MRVAARGIADTAKSSAFTMDESRFVSAGENLGGRGEPASVACFLATARWITLVVVKKEADPITLNKNIYAVEKEKGEGG